MNKEKNKNFDEEELRKKVRSDLLARHKQKQVAQNDLSAGKTESHRNEELLKQQIKKYIRLRLEERILRKYPQFVKCSNHLGEIQWLTAFEIQQQHEFYPADENLWQKLIARRKFKLPKLDWVVAYAKEVEQEIVADIEQRLAKIAHESKTSDAQTADEVIKKIVAQEEESFFRSHPSYKRYKSYTGQTKWLTKEEFENQEEFFEEVKSPWQIALKYIGIVVIAAILGLLTYLFVFNHNEQNIGHVLVHAGKQSGQIYIDERLMLGYSPDRPLKLGVGAHRIDFKKAGFVTDPPFYDITLGQKDTLHLQFTLTPIDTTNQAVIVFNANAVDAKIFINNAFSGTVTNNRKYFINPGKHRITLKKDNFNTNPPFMDISAGKRDTLTLHFSFSPQSQQPVKAIPQEGLIEVTANINGARIFINDQDTGQEANYIFNRIPYGRHRIMLKMPGYTINPPFQDITIAKDNQHAKVAFEIKQEMFPVRLTVEPDQGKIFVDNKEVGSGSWQGVLSRGDHVVDFGELKYYQKPEARKIALTETGQNEFYFKYNFKFGISFTPEEIRPPDYSGSIQLGYISDERDFHSDPSNGPETVRSDILNHLVWQLGYAFKYRNPPECDAIRFSFSIPREVNLKEALYLKIWGYKTKEKYPLSISNTSRIQIIVNNKIVKNEYEPLYAIGEAGADVFEQIQVNSSLQHDKNYIRIATNAKNSVYYLLWKIAIE